MSKIAFGELLGFAGLEFGNGVRDDAFDSRVGAKVGKEPPGPFTSVIRDGNATLQADATVAEKSL